MVYEYTDTYLVRTDILLRLKLQQNRISNISGIIIRHLSIYFNPIKLHFCNR